MTPEQLAVVERVRANMAKAKSSRAPAAKPETEAAARYAYETGVTYAEAAARFGVSLWSVWRHFRRLYPSAARKRGRRLGATQLHAPGRLAAIAAHDEQLTFHFGVTSEAVRLQYDKLYPDEPRRPQRRKAGP